MSSRGPPARDPDPPVTTACVGHSVSVGDGQQCVCRTLEPVEQIDKANLQDFGLLAFSLEATPEGFTCMVCGQRWVEGPTTMRRA